MKRQEMIDRLAQLGILPDRLTSSGRRIDSMDDAYLRYRLDAAEENEAAIINAQTNSPEALAARDHMAKRAQNLSRVEPRADGKLQTYAQMSAAADAMPTPEGFNSPAPARTGMPIFDSQGRLKGVAR